MEVRRGCKQTGIGIFPDDWEEKKVKHLGDVVTGSTPSTVVREYWGGNIPWVTPTDISTQKDISTTDREITSAGLAAIRKLPPNSVLVTCIASIGKNAILKKEGASNQQINAIIPNKECNVDFLYYLFENSKQYLLSNAGITATNIISKREFSELSFVIPEYHEQHLIAATLSDMDALLTAMDKLITKKRLVKQGAMQELLTGEKRLHGFSSVWVEKQLGDLIGKNGGIVDGPFGSNLKNSDYVDDGIPVLQGLNISKNKYVWKDVRYINKQKAKDLYRSNARVGDLLTVKIGSVGFSAIIDNLEGYEYAIIPANLLRVRLDPEIADISFICYLLTSSFGKDKLSNLAGNTAQPALSLAGFRKLYFLIPTQVEEQTAIAEILSDMDAEIAALEARREKTRLLKQGMMQELLTGRIRLI